MDAISDMVGNAIGISKAAAARFPVITKKFKYFIAASIPILTVIAAAKKIFLWVFSIKIPPKKVLIMDTVKHIKEKNPPLSRQKIILAINRQSSLK